MTHNAPFVLFPQSDLHVIEQMSADERVALAALVQRLSNYPFAWKTVSSGDNCLTIDRLQLVNPIVDVLLLCGHSEMELESMDEMQAMAAIARIASAHASSDRTEAVTVGRVRDMLEAIEGGRARCDCVDLLKHKWWFNSSKLPSYLGGGSWNKKGGRATEHKSHGHNYRTWMPKVRRYGNAEDAGVHVEIDMDHMRTAQSDDHAFIDIIVTAPAGNPRDARITQAVASYGIGGEVKTIQVKPETLEQVVPGRAWEALVAGAAELVIGEFVGDGWSAGRIVFPHVIEQCLVSACACVYFHE